MVGGIENEGESMPRTRKNHPPSLKAKVAIEAIKAQKTTTQISPNVRRSPNPSRRLEETSLGRFAERLRYSSPEWMAAFGPPPGWPAPPPKYTPDFVQTMGSTSVLHSQITIGNSHLISAYQHLFANTFRADKRYEVMVERVTPLKIGGAPLAGPVWLYAFDKALV